MCFTRQTLTERLLLTVPWPGAGRAVPGSREANCDGRSPALDGGAVYQGGWARVAEPAGVRGQHKLPEGWPLS